MFKLRNRPSTPARTLMSPINDVLRGYKESGEALLAHPFKGITTDGHVVSGLSPIQRTGVSTAPIKDAADAFLASLSAEQSASATFAVDDQAWRRWSNIHPWVMRHGVSLDAMTPAQRDRALELLRETLSAAGFRTARDVMTLSEAIREITGRDDEYGE